MKKLFFLFFVLIVMMAGAVAFFILTFDANHYRSIIEEKIQSATGNAVEVGHLSLTWQEGVALGIKRLTVYPGPQSAGDPALQLDSVNAKVHFWPLLRRDLQVSSIVFRHPVLRLVRGRDGVIRFLMQQVRPSGEGGASTGRVAAVPLALLSSFIVETIEIQNGEVYYRDEARPKLLETHIRKIDLALTDVSLTRPITIKGQAAVLNREPNVEIEGQLLLPLRSGETRVRNVILKIDLGKIAVEELFRLFPEIVESGLQKDVFGKFQAEADEIILGREGVQNWEVVFHFRDGKVAFSKMGSPLEKVNLKGKADSEKASIDEFSFQWGKGSIEGNAAAEITSSRLPFNFNVTAHELLLEELMPSGQPSDLKYRGILGLKIQGNAQGSTLDTLRQTLTGRGEIQVQGCVIENLNIPKEIFGKLSMIPGLEERLKARLPEDYRKKFEERNTVLDPIHILFSASNGVIYSDNLMISSETFMLTGRWQVDLNKNLSCHLMYVMDPQMSGAVIRSVNELQYLADREGRLQIPIQGSGTLDRPVFFPDFQYVTSKLAMMKMQEWVGDLLGKPTQPKQDPSKSTGETDLAESNSPSQPQSQQAPTEKDAAPSSPKPTTYQDLLSGLLQTALQTTNKDES